MIVRDKTYNNDFGNYAFINHSTDKNLSLLFYVTVAYNRLLLPRHENCIHIEKFPVSKKLKSFIKLDVEPSNPDLLQTKANSMVEDIKINPPLEGAELFSLFTANIIKEEKVFTR